jgi:hypothetical protein
MRVTFAMALCGTLIGTASAFADGLTLTEWNVDIRTARVLRHDPIVIGGGIASDRILFDVHRESDDAQGTLSISCATEEYALWTVGGGQLLVGLEPLSQWPLAAQAAAATCAQIDFLPQADGMTPLEIKRD